MSRPELPDEFTPETVRSLPIAVVRRLRDPHNGILSRDEQRAFDAALHEVMSSTAARLERQMHRSDWSRLAREAGRPRADDASSRGGRTGSDDPDPMAARRIARRIERQLRMAQELAPTVDWSFADGGSTTEQLPPATGGGNSATDVVDTPGTESISDLEEHVTDQVELVQALSELSDISRRTYALEQERDLQSTRGVFFGFVVSVAVIVAGWAPVVTAPSWADRWWMVGLTLVTCAIAGLVYFLVLNRQRRRAGE